MKYIGAGGQYRVYDLGNGRVFKRYRGRLSAFMRSVRTFSYRRHSLLELPRYAPWLRDLAKRSISALKQIRPDFALFGNPAFHGKLDYEQDLAIPVGQYVNNLSPAEVRHLIDSFVDLNRRLIAQGVVEHTFDIGTNFGIGRNGNVIVLDLGGLLIGSDDISGRLAVRPWSRHYALKTLPEPLRDYFVARMDREFLT